MQTVALSEATRTFGQRGDTEEIFTNPQNERTQGHIAGRVG